MIVNPRPYDFDFKPRINKPLYKYTVLVDADTYIYSAGFAVQRKSYSATYKDKIITIEGKRKLNELIAEQGEPESIAEEDILEPFKNCAFILKSYKKKLKAHTLDAKQLWFLTKGSTVFRNETAQLLEYKANRKESSKPLYYEEARDYLLKNSNVSLCDGYEADDVVAHLARQNPLTSIICSADKDLQTVAGLHLDPKKVEEGPYSVDGRQACINFYVQALTGDKVDNIKGLSGTKAKKGWGPAGAKKFLEGMASEEAMMKFVANEYKDKYSGTTTLGWRGNSLSWVDVLLDNLNLLYLRVDKEDKFTWKEK